MSRCTKVPLPKRNVALPSHSHNPLSVSFATTSQAPVLHPMPKYLISRPHTLDHTPLQSLPYACDSGGDASALALVIKVAKLEATLRQERAAAEAATGQLQATVARLEAQVTLEAERRLSEQLRAIIEGAPF